jgi:hypothetical protein
MLQCAKGEIAHIRIILLLTRVYSGANPFFLGRLGGRDERETARTLAVLEWVLTEAGLKACSPPRSERPGNIVKHRLWEEGQ